MRQDMVDDRATIADLAVKSLGLGFDLASDFRLRFAKGSPGDRLVDIDEKDTRDVVIAGGETIVRVPNVIRCDKGDRIRFRSDVLEFNQSPKMSELLNQKSSIQGKVPSGYFNVIFDLTGSWYEDATDTKYLAFDGYFISLYNFHLTASPLVLREKVKKAVPSNWEPAELSSIRIEALTRAPQDGHLTLPNPHIGVLPPFNREEEAWMSISPLTTIRVSKRHLARSTRARGVFPDHNLDMLDLLTLNRQPLSMHSRLPQPRLVRPISHSSIASPSCAWLSSATEPPSCAQLSSSTEATTPRARLYFPIEAATPLVLGCLPRLRQPPCSCPHINYNFNLIDEKIPR
ncbi:hypothetical protein ACLOJK_024274 [Asimina triloba]